jgi:hypothetical protein
MNKISRWYSEVTTRSIVAAPYAVSAIFSGVFLEIKSRLKTVLHSKVLYVDGLTPTEIASAIRASGGFRYAIEDDLSQQDRQTTHDVIAVEALLYKELGLDPDLVDFYMECHRNWKWKGHGISGLWDAMRLTGQVTTAIGNAITNMVVHNRFYYRNASNISLLMLLGDDIIMLSDKLLNVKSHGTETKEVYNMVSKISQRKYVGGFLSMLVYDIDGMTGICPHFKRLRHRYSLCNYTFSGFELETKLNSRALSYCFMLGDNPSTRAICEKLGYNVKLPSWYHMPAAIAANAMYDTTDEFNVKANISSLVAMLERHQPITQSIVTWSST